MCPSQSDLADRPIVHLHSRIHLALRETDADAPIPPTRAEMTTTALDICATADTSRSTLARVAAVFGAAPTRIAGMSDGARAARIARPFGDLLFTRGNATV